ncbi:MAG TPA: GatB/YqeY domain-containing protein [Alphaproteobacteria bacterium]|nr:GatB/YqeY domain-containing protein [Alphaproteobacteria bacterium]
MLRDRLNAALKDAMRAKDQRRVSTIRLILAAVKDRDIAGRSEESREGVPDEEILQILSKMIRQRQDSIEAYEKADRMELAAQEREEIQVIESFQPPQLSEQDIHKACAEAVEQVEAKGLKDMGRTMAVLKERYAGLMDFSKASAIVKNMLSGQD